MKRACPVKALALAPTQFESMGTRFGVQALAHLIDFFTGNLVVWSKLGADLGFQSYKTR